MNIDKKHFGNIRFIFSIIFSLPSIIIMSQIAKDGLLINDIDYETILLLLIIGIVIYFIIFKLMNRKIYRIVFIISCIICFGVIYAWRKELIINFINREIINNVLILYDSIYNGEPTFFLNYKPLLIVFLPVVYIIILFISDKVYMNLMSIINFVILISLWVVERELCNKYVYIILFQNFIFTVISSVISMCKKDIKNLNTIRMKKNIIWIVIIPIIIEFSIVVTILPIERQGKVTENEYDEFLKSTLYGKNEKDKEYILKRGFNLCTVGYSDTDKKLGGSIKINKKPLMYIKSKNQYFLKGSVKDQYTGYSWHSTKKQDEIQLDAGSLGIYNVGDDKNDEMKNNTLKFYGLGTNRVNIKYKDNYMNGVFISPNMLKEISINQKGTIKYNSEQEIRFSDIIDSDYSLEVYDIRTTKDKNVLFKEEVIDSKERYEGYMDYTTVKIDNVGEKWIDNFLYAKDSGLIKNNYERYVQLPNNIPYRVYELSNKITSGCTDTLSKVNAIKKYLEKNYKYSLTVDRNMKDKEFVDNFLFNEKKGYCTYFATAMTILCRMQGIPARYVEGFNMHNVEKKGEEYVIGSECAHAWCEVLVSPEQNIWTIADPKVTDISQLREQTTTQFLDDDSYDEEKEKDKFRQRKLEKRQERQIDSTDSSNNISKDNIKNEFKKYIKNLTVGGKFVFLTIVAVLLYIILIIYRYIRYIMILKDKSIIGLYKYYIKSLKYMGFTKDYYMTDLEFVETLKGFSFYECVRIVILETNREYYGCKKSTIDRKKYYKSMKKYIKNKNYRYKK